MKLRSPSLKQRLTGFAIVSGLIALLMGGVGYAAVRSLTAAMDGALVSTRALQNHTQADMRMDALRADALRGLHAVQTNNEVEKKALPAKVQQDIAELRGKVAENAALPLDPEIKAAIAKLNPLVEPFIAASQQEIDLVFRDPAAAAANYNTFLEGFGALEDTMDATRELMRDSVAKNQEAATMTAALANGGLLAVLAGGLLLIIVSTFFIIRAITRPLAGMTAAMAQLAAGDISVSIPANDRTDEIGAMAHAVQVFKQAAVDAIRIEVEATETRRLAEDGRSRTEAERATAAAEQAHVVEAIATGLERLSGGDLVFRLREPFGPEYEKLRVDFNDAMEKLQDTMKVVSVTTSAIRSGADGISSGADNLSRRTEQQAASLEETAAALDEITATVRKTAEGSNHARQVVGGAKRDAEHSGQVVRKAVEAMSGIEKSSDQIGQIIGVIDEIAFQTNLLALNAGVEAARAGDAGRGFAVVASEVRALAQRSAEAAKEIKALISTSSHQVEQGVDLVGQTGEALERIVVQVAEIDGIVNDIAASAQEQATALDEVNTAINQMDQMTQQNAAMVEESTAASHALSHETEELGRLISGFDVGRENIVASARPARPVSKPAPVAALKIVGRSGAARKPETQAAG
jgi:methyl-accepting chemotaxis protein